MKKTIYLDYAAATPMDPQVLLAMQPYFSEQFYNPSATYLAAQTVAKDIAGARATVAHHLGVTPAEIVFTAGGTEANNLAIHGVMQAHPNTKLLVSAVEHESVLRPADAYPHKLIPVRADGQVDLEALEAMIDDHTVLVSIMYANNEIGTIQPLKAIAQVLATIRQARQSNGNSLPLYLHTDACQAAATLDLHVHGLGVDLMTLNGGKIYGPKQSGALFIRRGVTLKPHIQGGGQENGFRSGTENVPAIMGFAKALSLVQERRGSENKRLEQLQQLFISSLKKQLPETIVNGSLKRRLPNNIHLTFPGQDNERLMMQLDEKGVICAAGSACSASQEEPSHVLKAIGLSDQEAQSSLRFSMGVDTSEAAVQQTIEALVAVMKEKQA